MQLEACGIVETIHISAAGFPIRYNTSVCVNFNLEEIKWGCMRYLYIVGVLLPTVDGVQLAPGLEKQTGVTEREQSTTINIWTVIFSFLKPFYPSMLYLKPQDIKNRFTMQNTSHGTQVLDRGSSSAMSNYSFCQRNVEALKRVQMNNFRPVVLSVSPYWGRADRHPIG